MCVCVYVCVNMRVCRVQSGRVSDAKSEAVRIGGLSGALSEADLVVLMSNGGFGGIHDKLLRALSVTPGAA